MNRRPTSPAAVSRRRFLRGAGAVVGLPWLESIAGAAEAAGPPVRFAALFMGNGVNTHHWGATMGPGGIEFGKTLAPLAPHAAKVNFFRGLWNPTTAEGHNGHYSNMNVLSGLVVKRTTTDVEVGSSVDQLMAQAVGRGTPLPSIVLGTEGPGYSTDSGFTQLYSNYVSWSSPTTPTMGCDPSSGRNSCTTPSSASSSSAAATFAKELPRFLKSLSCIPSITCARPPAARI
jgi:hypothetical protein